MTIEDFPTRVRTERKRRRLTQKQLADTSGVSLRMIQMLEGRTSPGTPANRHAIASALGISVDGDDTAAPTRASWPAEVQVFLDMAGAYLMTLPEDRRLGVIHDVTRHIFSVGQASPEDDLPDSAAPTVVNGV